MKLSALTACLLLSCPGVTAQLLPAADTLPRQDTSIPTLPASRRQLQSVEVVGRTSKQYNSDYSFSVTKIGVSNKDIPQSISTVTKEFIADRQAFRAGDAIRYINGVSPVSFYSHYAIRGLTRNEETRIYNGMRTSQYLFNQPLTNNIERIEVIKGPASATISNADPGGSINMVTKKPLAEARRQVSLGIGSFDTYRAAVDLTGPLNKQKTLLYRLNIGYEDAQSFRNLIYRKAYLLAPSITYIIDDKSQLNVELVVGRDQSRLDRGQPIFGAVDGKTPLNTTPINYSMSMPNDRNVQQDIKFFGNFTHRFSSHIGFNLSYMKQVWREDLFEHRTNNAFAVDSAGKSIPTLAAMQIFQRLQRWTTDNITAYFNIDWKTGPVLHKLVAGYDYLSLTKPRGNTQNTAKGYRNADNTGIINNYDPAKPSQYQYTTIDGKRVPVPNVPYFNLASPQYLLRNESDFLYSREEFAPSKYQANAIYVQDQLSFRQFILTVGLRQEWYQDILNHQLPEQQRVNQHKLIGRMGLSYAINQHINAYATYVQGYNPQTASSIIQPNAGGPFDPLITDMREAGVKTEWLGGLLKASVAYYDISSRNILVYTGLDKPALAQRGAEGSRGLEVEVSGRILPGWQIMAGYAYTDARITDDIKQENIGLRKENTPWNSGSLWTRYDFRKAALKGLGLGAGMQYRGERIPWLSRAFLIPGYTVVDAAIYYKIRDIQVAVNVNNLFNKTYWTGAYSFFQLFPGEPRNVQVNVTYQF